MRDLVTPRLNINGTSSTALVAQLCDITHHLRKVEEALAAANPHGRDYPTVDEWRQARDAWHDRRVAIRTMLSELELHAYAIVDQDTRVITTKENNL